MKTATQRIASALIAAAALTSQSVFAFSDEAGKPPDYLTAVQQELARLAMSAQCNTVSKTCHHTSDIRLNDTDLVLTIRYSPATDTIYICFEQLLRFQDKTELSRALAVKLLSLNREMVSAKFEWDEERRAVRLSTSVNTDSNFDRKAFRSQVKGLVEIARSLGPTLASAE